MQYARLGNSGLKVSRIILGCMSYGSTEWSQWVLSEEEGIAHIKAAYDLGITTFDTSDVYSNGDSEIILGKAIKLHSLNRDEIVIMTKAGRAVGRDKKSLFGMGKDDLYQNRYTNQWGTSRKHLMAAIKRSLERLQVGYVDVFMCHRFDPDTPIEETMHALHDIVQSGMARYIGMSSCYAWQFHKMQAYAKENGLTEFIVMQNLYNPLYREEEREMMPLLEDLGVGMTPWGPLACGYLARPINEDDVETSRQSHDKAFNARMAQVPYLKDLNRQIQEIAESHSASMAQVVLAWSLSKSVVTAPIIGTTSIEKMKDAVGCFKIALSEGEVLSIDAFYQPRGVFGHV